VPAPRHEAAVGTTDFILYGLARPG
jgi:hypothetical protein